MNGRVVSLNRSNGGVPKLPVEQARVTSKGMEGDRQRDWRFHGGPKRALSLYSLELIEQLQLEGHPIAPGAVGENVTIMGIDWREMEPGRVVSIGEIEIELTSFASPCKTIRRAFLDEDFTRISHKLHPGWSRLYARVLREGTLRVGDSVLLRAADPVLF
jgi:MOSC domain-containing protein YiiM